MILRICCGRNLKPILFHPSPPFSSPSFPPPLVLISPPFMKICLKIALNFIFLLQPTTFLSNKKSDTLSPQSDERKMNMKKIMLIAAAAAGLVAMADGVESGVVGYNTVTIDKQWTIMSVNFTKPDGTAMTINEAFPYVEGMTQGQSGGADEIQIQNATGGYDTYYMANGKVGKATVDEIVGKWVKDGTTVAADASIPVGKGAWYRRRGSTDFNLVITKPYDL